MVREWNSLNLSVRNLVTLSKFKKAIRISKDRQHNGHFFLACTKCSEKRNDLFLSISDLSQLINTSLLTSGSETLSYADNCFIFYSVFRFTKKV
jgi:hypothetical protein